MKLDGDPSLALMVQSQNSASARVHGPPWTGVVRSYGLHEAEEFAAPGRFGVLLFPAALAGRAEEFRQARDAEGLPCWSVIVLEDGFPESMGGLKASVVGLKPLLELAWTDLASRRELEVRRGDLRTLAQRVSHDLRTPVSGIISTGELVAEIMGGTKAGSEPLITPLFDSAYELLGLVEQLRLVLKATADPQEPVEVEVEAALQAAAQRVEGKLLKRRISLRLPARLPRALGVADWLDTVWTLLLLHTAELCGPDCVLHVGAFEEDDRAWFWVALSPLPAAAPSGVERFPSFHQFDRRDRTVTLSLGVVERLVSLQGGEAGFLRTGEARSGTYFVLNQQDRRLAAGQGGMVAPE